MKCPVRLTASSVPRSLCSPLQILLYLKYQQKIFEKGHTHGHLVIAWFITKLSLTCHASRTIKFLQVKIYKIHKSIDSFHELIEDLP